MDNGRVRAIAHPGNEQDVGMIFRFAEIGYRDKRYEKDRLKTRAWFNFSIFAGNKSWVAGVELATASEPPARKPRIWGRRPSGVDPSHPLRCNLLLNLARAARDDSDVKAQ
jgi:hypothetical protein